MVHVNDAGQAARLARTVNKVLKVFYFAGLIGLLLVVGMLVLATLGPERFSLWSAFALVAFPWN